MVLQLMLPGYCQIPLYERAPGSSRDNFHPEKTVWTICGYTTVDSDNYRWLNQYKWLRVWDSHTQSYYVKRTERLPNGKYVNVWMAREVLGLPWVAGKGGDQAEHRNHDTIKNTRDNLRRATPSQNQINRKSFNNSCRFKNVHPNGLGFRTHLKYNYQHVQFLTVRTDVEAALMYNYAAYLLWGEFAHLNQIPEDEMPSYERQAELYDMVVKKLTEKGLLNQAEAIP
jgi:hypothetical protein